MKLSVLLFIVAFITDPGKIGKINSTKREAKKAFEAKDFKTAISKYKYLVDSLGVQEDEVSMNLANAYFQSNDSLSAIQWYTPLTQSKDARIRSLANQQLGVLANHQGKPDEALTYFKNSMKAAPENDDARFNYELIKKKLAAQNKDQQNQNKNNDKGKPQEPSEFAKQLKAKADALVKQHFYQEAFDLMSDGLKKDKTVSTYQEFITRTKDVAGIAK
jgi:predicted negative regulator of RcsB-dependent stress response